MRLSIPLLPAVPRFFWQRDFGILAPCRRDASRRWPRVSGLFQDERAAVSEIDFRGFPSGFGALVPEFESGVGSGFVIVGWNPGADRLPWRVDGLEGFDVERWVRWRREADEPLMSLTLHPSGCLSAVYLRCFYHLRGKLFFETYINYNLLLATFLLLLFC